MRILFVNQYFPPDVSATAYLLGELCEDLSATHDVTVVSGRPSYNPRNGSSPPQGVCVRRVWSTSFTRANLAGRAVNYFTFLIGSILLACRGPAPDVVVSFTDPPVIGVVGALAAARWRRPFLQVYQDLFPEIAMALGKVSGPGVTSLWRRVNHLVRTRSNRVGVVGRDMGDLLETQGVPRGKLVWLPNWGRGETPSPREVARARERLGWTDRFVVMHAGNLGLSQDLHTVLRAAKSLDRAGVLFVLIGDGAARPGLQAEARSLGLDNVVFLPYLPKDDVAPLIAAADVHIVSLASGLLGAAVPSKVYGILGMGKPFIAAVERGSEIDRIIRDTSAGVRIDPGDADALNDAVRGFLDGALDGRQMGANGRQAFVLDYARAVGTGRYAELLASMVGVR